MYLGEKSRGLQSGIRRHCWVFLSVCFLGEAEDNMEVLEISIPKTQTMEATSPERPFGSHAYTPHCEDREGWSSRRERDL